MLGCAVVFGAVTWLAFFLFLYFGSDAGFWESAGTGAVVGGVFSIAVLGLGLRDWLQYSRRLNAVQRRLKARPPVSDDIAMDGIAAEDRPNLLEVRRLVADFFDVPDDRLRANDRLDRDYSFHDVEPSLHWNVVLRAASARGIQPTAFWQFDSGKLETLADFAFEVERALNAMKSETPPTTS